MKVLVFIFVLSATFAYSQNTQKTIRSIDKKVAEINASRLFSATDIDSIPFPMRDDIVSVGGYYTIKAWYDLSGIRRLVYREHNSQDDSTSFYLEHGKPICITETFWQPTNSIWNEGFYSRTYYFSGKKFIGSESVLSWSKETMSQVHDSVIAHTLLRNLDWYTEMLADKNALDDDSLDWPAEIGYEKLYSAVADDPAKALRNDLPSFLNFPHNDKTIEVKRYPGVQGPDGHGRETLVYYLLRENVFYLYSDCVQGHIDRFQGPFSGNPKKVLAK